MSKQTTNMIVKGVILYLAIISILLEVLVIDSLGVKSFIFWSLINFYAITQISTAYTWKEIKFLTGNTYLSKHYPELFDTDNE